MFYPKHSYSPGISYKQRNIFAKPNLHFKPS